MTKGQKMEGNRMNDILMAISPFPPPRRGLRAVVGPFPTLKRGANDRCAPGAIEIGTSLVNKRDSCDCPGKRRSVGFQAGLI